MSLDGVFMRHLKHELEQSALGAKVEKVFQPTRNEIILQLRTKNESRKLLFSTQPGSGRVCFSSKPPENPAAPPMFCMLLRKKLIGARLSAITQPQLERMLYFRFDGFNEFGEPAALTLVIELMGRSSNIILLDQNDVIIDALRRIHPEDSPKPVVPGFRYSPPAMQDKLSPLTVPYGEIANMVNTAGETADLQKSLLHHIQGISPLVARELAFRVADGSPLEEVLEALCETAQKTSGTPYCFTSPEGTLLNFSFLPLYHLGKEAVRKQAVGFSELLDNFFFDRDKKERARVKAQSLNKLVGNLCERAARKISLQTAELEACKERETLRIYGDLLSSNLHRLEKGTLFVELENYYSPGCDIVRINTDPLLTPVQNAQKYYKQYKKLSTAEVVLTEQLRKAKADLEYYVSVLDALSRAETEKELSAIRDELTEQGCLKATRTKQKPASMTPPLHFTSTDGFSIYVGRNNRQNDLLTLKMAKKHDIWLHTQKIPGAHVVISTDGAAPPDTTLEEAAAIAAFHSKARQSNLVPVDYTQVKNVRKPADAKPGMVIYDKFKTIFTHPKELL